jgi:cell division protein ZapA
MASKTTTATEVEIFGAIYHVRGDKNPEYLQELAGVVDEKMRDIAHQVSTVDTAKIAILAALNVTDELFQCRRQQEGERAEIQEKVTELTEQLEESLQK